MSNPARLMMGDCIEKMGEIESGTVDAIITDPPYPEIDRPYGRMSEADWHAMMRAVVDESRRVLKPSGSAVFILQPNSEKAGKMRPWLWEFMAWTTREWGMVQDAWWWNNAALPTAGATTKGLMRGSIKPCVWLGRSDCHRNQDAVLWGEHEAGVARRASGRLDKGRQKFPSGNSVDRHLIHRSAGERGGVTPFNLIPIPTLSQGSAGMYGHGAGTPINLADWWVRYISPPDGVVCDPFMGSGTMGLAALARGRSFIGIERDPGYFQIAESRIAAARSSTPLFAAPAPA